jgi:hypothetical protein
MRRWLSRFISFFVIALLPGVVGWGLLVRWNRAGPGRFVRFWSWLADRLAFPLLLRPATDPAKRWLLHGSGLLGALGFVILVAIWCLMLALPLSVIVAWAEWFGRRLDPTRSQPGGYDPYSTIPLALPVSPARNLLYFVTIPLALCWHLLRRMLRPMLIGFAVAWTVRFLYLILMINRNSPAEFSRRLSAFETERRGRFALLGTTPLFARVWSDQLKPTQHLTRQLAKDSYFFHNDVARHLNRYPYVLKLFALDAALYAIAAGLAVGLVFAAVRTAASLKS